MFRHAAMLALLALLALTNSGCAVMMLGQGGHEGGSGSLSEAAAQAAPDTTTRYKTPPPPPPDVGYTTPPSVSASVEVSSAPALAPESAIAPGPVPQPHPYVRRNPLYVGLVGGGGALGGQDYDGFGTLGLSVTGRSQERVWINGAVTLNGLEFKNTGYLGTAFQNPTELNLDVTGRFFLTRDKTLMGLYGLVGAGTGTLFWDYGRPVTVTEDGKPKTLNDDYLNYFSFFGGAGVSLIQTRYVHVGGNAAGGVRFYGWHTDGGLKNNMFKTTGFLKILVEFSFRVATT